MKEKKRKKKKKQLWRYFSKILKTKKRKKKENVIGSKLSLVKEEKVKVFLITSAYIQWIPTICFFPPFYLKEKQFIFLILVSLFFKLHSSRRMKWLEAISHIQFTYGCQEDSSGGGLVMSSERRRPLSSGGGEAHQKTVPSELLRWCDRYPWPLKSVQHCSEGAGHY